ncbi:MAG: c-type cytochrome [Candidatus Rariloculaceae bacterium]
MPNVRGRDSRYIKHATICVALSFLLPVVWSDAFAQGPDDEPSWAYSIGTPAISGDTVFTLPGSDRSFTFDEIRAVFGPADWYPGDHPTMPDIVANGRFPRVWACALCHYPNGQGRPENAGISGLPRDYFIQTLYDFRNGLRASAQPRKFNTSTMVTMAQGMTEEEIEAAADYYSSMPWRQWTRVVETDEVPRTRIILGMYVPLEGDEAGMEPLGLRIIEVPEEPHRTEVMRDPRNGFIAYVPYGSVERGEELVTTGGAGKTIQCAICHGQDLNGLGNVPGLAGRSPSYAVRQLYDMREGSRIGVATALMQPTVANLTVADMIDIAAYLGSVPPPQVQDEE